MSTATTIKEPAMPKPTRAQAALIRYFAGDHSPEVLAARTPQPTYEACRKAGWIEPIEEHPFHRTTSAGRVAVGLPAER